MPKTQPWIFKMKKEANLLFTLPPGPNPPEEIYCLVEIPEGGSNKYEYHKKWGVFVLDRVLYGAVFYPTEYGFIPGTWAKEDHDPLDVMVLCSSPTFPGCLLKARPIGALEIDDSGEQDTKIIAVAIDDPRSTGIKTLKDLHHLKKEIKNFWENYAELQPGKEIKILGWKNAREARKIIDQAIKTFNDKFLKK